MEESLKEAALQERREGLGTGTQREQERENGPSDLFEDEGADTDMTKESARGAALAVPASTQAAEVNPVYEDTFAALLSSCDSIIATCLSYRTITPSFLHDQEDSFRGGARTSVQQDSLSEILFERTVSRWLDEKILEAEKYCRWISQTDRGDGYDNSLPPLALRDGPFCSSSSFSPLNDANPLLREKWRYLLARTSQWQLQHRWLKRCLVFQQQLLQQQQQPPMRQVPPEMNDPPNSAEIASQLGGVSDAAFLPDTAHWDASFFSTATTLESGSIRPQHHNLMQRRQRAALSARDRQVTEALRLDRELSQIQEQRASIREECDQLNRWNRALWSQVSTAWRDTEKLEKQRQLAFCSSVNSCSRKARLELENRLLKRLLVDLVVGAGSSCSIDWLSDDRLRNIVTCSRPF
jgi:hypothetical protein